MEEEGDLKLFVFTTMEYERELKNKIMCKPKCSEVEEGVFIVGEEN